MTTTRQKKDKAMSEDKVVSEDKVMFEESKDLDMRYIINFSSITEKLSHLINIRNFMYSIINGNSVSKEHYKLISSKLFLLDKKIISLFITLDIENELKDDSCTE